MKQVKGYIRRKSMLYVTGVEYGNYTMNHVFGCAHGCKYPCYAYLQKKRFGQVDGYENWIEPYLVSNTLELLEKEIPKLKNKIQSVHLCFTTDPFMYGYDEISKMSISSIKKLNESGIKCTVLTKSILPKELAQLSSDNEYGITLVSLDENFRKEYEPNSASFEERIESLKTLHRMGCKTWISIEPYPTPNLVEQNIIDILNEVSFCDKVIFGRIHYNKKASAYKNHKAFFNETAKTVIDFCEKNNISYHIKNGTITDEDIK